MAPLPDPPAAVNDNRPTLARHVPIVGRIADDGAVTFTDPTWWPRQIAPPATSLFPADPREA